MLLKARKTEFLVIDTRQTVLFFWPEMASGRWRDARHSSLAAVSLGRAQVSLLGRVRCALGYGIDSARFARRCGIDVNKKSNGSRSASEPSTLAPVVFPPYPLLPNGSWGRGPGGFSHTLPIRVCAAQRGRDFEAPDLERGIHFRGVF